MLRVSNLTKHLRKSRQKSSVGSTRAASDGSSEPSNGGVASTQSSASSASASVNLKMPTPEPAPVISMPVPKPTPSSVAPEPSRAMDAALAELTPLQANIERTAAQPSNARSFDITRDKADGIDERERQENVDAVERVASALATTEVVQKIERGIQRFADNMPWLMKTLDEVAKIHPVVTTVVLAFKAVYYLESTRQENDRRVMTLYVEMKDMMMVIVQLKGIESRKHVGLDGSILEDRLETIAKQTADNIKTCANFCDTFLKKKTLVKVLKGPLWAEKLAEFTKTFMQRKGDFELALAMHTANSISDVKAQNYQIDAKLDAVLGLFAKFVTTEERRLAAEVESSGGLSKARNDDGVLKSLIALDSSMSTDRSKAEDVELAMNTTVHSRNEKVKGSKKSLTLDDLKIELREDIDDTLERNLDTFSGKFELQIGILQAALEQYIHAENDRVIGAVTDAIAQGPHMRIRDPVLRRIWQEMNWRGSVKARVFVMTLQEYYRELYDHAAPGSQNDDGDNGSDQWALEYLGVTWLQPIMEAFDEDSSGYVTTSEVNKLMDMRPLSLSWSIPHWMAYWAIGWRLVGGAYTHNIIKLLSLMRDAIPTVLPRNRESIDQYFNIWWQIAQLVQGFQDNEALLGDDALLDRFRDLMEYEENRIRGNLQKIKYRIDASDTLALVLGQGPLEKSIFLLLYLLLENDWRKIRAAKSVVLSSDEIQHSHQSMIQVFSAVNRRHAELSALFEHQKLDTVTQFKKFAYGLFINIETTDQFWSFNNQHNDLFNTAFDEEDSSELCLDGLEIASEIPLDTTEYDRIDEETEDDLLAPSAIRAVLGEWNVFVHDTETYPIRPMITLHFHHSTQENEDFTASGFDFDGEEFTVRGTLDSESLEIKWTITYGADFDVYYTGRLVDEYTIVGTRASGAIENVDFSFVMKKIPAEYLIYRPSPMRLETHDKGEKYRALWVYAISAIVHDVRRKWWTWSLFAARRDVRKAYIELDSRRVVPYKRLELAGWRTGNLNLCTSKDAFFYESLSRYLATITICCVSSDDCACHFPEPHWPSGVRHICLQCTRQDKFFMPVVVCDDPACIGTTVERPKPDTNEPDFRHTPTHDLVKVRKIVFPLDLPVLLHSARESLAALRDPARNLGPPWRTVPSSPGGSVGSLRDVDAVQDSPAEDAPQSQPNRPVSPTPSVSSRTAAGDDTKIPHVTNHDSPDVSAPLETIPLVDNNAVQVDEKSASFSNADLQQDVASNTAPTEARKPVESTILPSRACDESLDTTLPAASDDPAPKQEGSIPAVLSPEAVITTNAESIVGAPKEEVNDSASSRASHDEDGGPPDMTWKCTICKEDVYYGESWWCITCGDFLCLDCESKTLISCSSCAKPFPQPSWYYGHASDNFLCNLCCARGVKPLVLEVAPLRHVYTHPTVFCRPFEFDDPMDLESRPPSVAGAVGSMETRLTRVEERLEAMDAKFEQLRERFDQLEARLETRMEKSQRDLQQAIIDRFSDLLVNALSGGQRWG